MDLQKLEAIAFSKKRIVADAIEATLNEGHNLLDALSIMETEIAEWIASNAKVNAEILRRIRE